MIENLKTCSINDLQKFKTNSYCVGEKHYSATKDIVGDITFIKKTRKEIKLSVG